MDVITLKTLVLNRLPEEEFAQFCLDHRHLPERPFAIGEPFLVRQKKAIDIVK